MAQFNTVSVVFSLLLCTIMSINSPYSNCTRNKYTITDPQYCSESHQILDPVQSPIGHVSHDVTIADTVMTSLDPMPNTSPICQPVTGQRARCSCHGDKSIWREWLWPWLVWNVASCGVALSPNYFAGKFLMVSLGLLGYMVSLWCRVEPNLFSWEFFDGDLESLGLLGYTVCSVHTSFVLGLSEWMVTCLSLLLIFS